MTSNVPEESSAGLWDGNLVEVCERDPEDEGLVSVILCAIEMRHARMYTRVEDITPLTVLAADLLDVARRRR